MSSRGRLLWLWLCFFAFLKSWEKTDFSNATTAVSFHSNTRALPLTNQIASCKHPERVRWALVWFSKCRRSWSLQQVILSKVDITTVRFPTGLWVIVFSESQNHQTSGNGLHVFFNMTRNEWLSPKLIRKLFRGQSWGSFYHRRLQNHCVCSHAL